MFETLIRETRQKTTKVVKRGVKVQSRRTSQFQQAVGNLRTVILFRALQRRRLATGAAGPFLMPHEMPPEP